ncbi:hypothetical protein QNI16_07180 [Cytophagaceae bacterium YF14B1]|uniref:Uncharacterized protein n=1 Tax=Xanthocytophaga flava TaxID=3048013 RepID=A0AAE3QKF9_9BACT|nr:hypothetical protein [Xanthocytophaga flavus]MDJ1480261.1 hypothetical protein [Xanthocytophaga flavus]
MRTVFTILLIIAISCIQLNQIGNLSLVLSQGGANWTNVFGYDLSLPAALTWAIGIELGVLVSVLAGAKKQAAVLAAGSCLINLLANQVIDFSWSHTAAKIVVYALSSYLLWYFCELFAEYSQQEQKAEIVAEIKPVSIESADSAKQPDTKSAEQKSAELIEPANQLVAEKVTKLISSAKKQPAKIKSAQADQLSCQYCQRADFSNQSALNAHVGRCKKKIMRAHNSAS